MFSSLFKWIIQSKRGISTTNFLKLSSSRSSRIESISNAIPFHFPLSSLFAIRSFKVKSAVKARCNDCYLVKRDGTLFVRCKTHPRHKQRQGRATVK